jgi:hypothetical protein
VHFVSAVIVFVFWFFMFSSPSISARTGMTSPGRALQFILAGTEKTSRRERPASRLIVFRCEMTDHGRVDRDAPFKHSGAPCEARALHRLWVTGEVYEICGALGYGECGTDQTVWPPGGSFWERWGRIACVTNQGSPPVEPRCRRRSHCLRVRSGLRPSAARALPPQPTKAPCAPASAVRRHAGRAALLHADGAADRGGGSYRAAQSRRRRAVWGVIRQAIPLLPLALVPPMHTHPRTEIVAKRRLL